MAYTQDDIDALREAIASGVRSIRHGEGSTEYQSLAEMRKQLAIMEQEVNGTNRAKRRSVGAYRSGT